MGFHLYMHAYDDLERTRTDPFDPINVARHRRQILTSIGSDHDDVLDTHPTHSFVPHQHIMIHIHASAHGFQQMRGEVYPRLDRLSNPRSSVPGKRHCRHTKKDKLTTTIPTCNGNLNLRYLQNSSSVPP